MVRTSSNIPGAPMKVFKVRKKGTEMFSTGGTMPRWSPKGKTWAAKAHVSNHLGLVDPHTYDNAEIVEYSVVESSTQNVADLMHAKEQAKLKKRLADAAAARQQQEQKEREQLRALQAKYGP